MLPAHVWLAQHLGKNPARLHRRGTRRVYRGVRTYCCVALPERRNIRALEYGRSDGTLGKQSDKRTRDLASLDRRRVRRPTEINRPLLVRKPLHGIANIALLIEVITDLVCGGRDALWIRLLPAHVRRRRPRIGRSDDDARGSPAAAKVAMGWKAAGFVGGDSLIGSIYPSDTNRLVCSNRSRQKVSALRS